MRQLSCRLLINLLLQCWTNDFYFKKVMLMQLGLWIQLSHSVHETCRNLTSSTGSHFMVLNINGIHEVQLDFCDCSISKPHFIQLLWYGWFPASIDQPKTATTLMMLKFFHLLNFELKASAFEFHNTLTCITDNTETSASKVCWYIICSIIFLIMSYLELILLTVTDNQRVPIHENAQMLNARIWSLWH